MSNDPNLCIKTLNHGLPYLHPHHPNRLRLQLCQPTQRNPMARMYAPTVTAQVIPTSPASNLGVVWKANVKSILQIVP